MMRWFSNNYMLLLVGLLALLLMSLAHTGGGLANDPDIAVAIVEEAHTPPPLDFLSPTDRQARRRDKTLQGYVDARRAEGYRVDLVWQNGIGTEFKFALTGTAGTVIVPVHIKEMPAQ